MNLTLPLTAEEEEKLVAHARARAATPEDVVKRAIDPIISSMADKRPSVGKPKKSMLGILAGFGSAPSAEEIDENRRDMFGTFGRDDIA